MYSYTATLSNGERFNFDDAITLKLFIDLWNIADLETQASDTSWEDSEKYLWP